MSSSGSGAVWSRCVLLTLLTVFWLSDCFAANLSGGNGMLCSPENVAVERVLHRHGLSASASVLMAKPKKTNNYILCYTKSTSGGRKSQIFCIYSAMDDLHVAEQQFVISIDGLVTHFETAATATHQYIIIFAVNRNPILYDVTIHENSRISFDSPRPIGNHGALQMAVSYTETSVALAVSSGRHCKDGDLMCTQPAVTVIDSQTGVLAHCSFPTQAEPAEFVATWSHAGTTYFAFAALLPNNPHVYWMTWHRLVQYGNGQCGIHYAGDITFKRPICGIRSIEMIKTVMDGIPKYMLLVASQACPEVLPPTNTFDDHRFVNVLHQTWDPVVQQFIGNAVGELPGTGTVTKITSMSDEFFLCQKASEPSSIHGPITMPMASGLLGTVRINNQATISAVQSANGEPYISHVTSAGAVVIDWISCTGNHHRMPSNFTLSRFASNPFVTGPSPYENINLNDTVDEYAGDNHILPIPANRKSFLNRSDRDSPHSWKLESNNLALSLNAPDSSNITSADQNQTDTTKNGANTMRYEDNLGLEITGQQQVDQPPKMPIFDINIPFNGPSDYNPNMGNGAPQVPIQPPQIMQENLPPPGFIMNYPFSGQPIQPQPAPMQQAWTGLPVNSGNNWPGQTQQFPNQQVLYSTPQNGYGMTPAVIGPNTPFPGQFIPNFGGPQHIPGGGTLAGYFTFPPIAVFAPVPQMPQYVNYNGGQQQPQQQERQQTNGFVQQQPQQINYEARPQQQSQQFVQQFVPPTPVQFGYPPSNPNQPINMPPPPQPFDVYSIQQNQLPRFDVTPNSIPIPMDSPNNQQRPNVWPEVDPRMNQAPVFLPPSPLVAEFVKAQEILPANSPLLHHTIIALPPNIDHINVSINNNYLGEGNTTVLPLTTDAISLNTTSGSTWTIPTATSISVELTTTSDPPSSTADAMVIPTTESTKGTAVNFTIPAISESTSTATTTLETTTSINDNDLSSSTVTRIDTTTVSVDSDA